MGAGTVTLTCPDCRRTFQATFPDRMIDTTESSKAGRNIIYVSCPICRAMHTYKLGDLEMGLTVEGSNADEVKDVASNLIKEMGEKGKATTIRNPWISGSFYLSAILVIGALFLVIAKMVHPLVFPIVIVGTMLGVALIGAFQLKQDKSLTQKNFLYLMALTFRWCPSADLMSYSSAGNSRSTIDSRSKNSAGTRYESSSEVVQT